MSARWCYEILFNIDTIQNIYIINRYFIPVNCICFGGFVKSDRLISSLVIGLGFPLTQLALVLYTPAFSVIANQFGVGADAMLMSFTIILFGYTVGTLCWGTLSDHFGRRTMMLMGLVIYIVVASLIPLTQTFWQFCVALSIYGFVAATFTSVGNAMLRDIYGKERVAQVVSYVGIAMATTPAVAPLIGSHLVYYFGWHSVYYVVSLIGLIMLLGVIKYVPVIPRSKKTSAVSLRSGIKSHLTNRLFLGYIICLGLLMGGLTSTIEMLPIIYTNYLSLSVITFGSLGLVFMSPYPLGAILSSRLVRQFGTGQVLVFGTLTGIIGCIGLTLFAILGLKQVAFVSVMLALIFLGFGLSLSMAKAGALSSVHEHTGSASSIMKFTQSLGGVVVTFINAQLHQVHAITNFSILMLMVISLAFITVKSCCK